MSIARQFVTPTKQVIKDDEKKARATALAQALDAARKAEEASPTKPKKPARTAKFKPDTASPKSVGRPSSGKVVTTLRLDPEIITALKAEGPGWQNRANEILRKSLNL
jgi:uncharacterized protein (DUF4415 family)